MATKKKAKRTRTKAKAAPKASVQVGARLSRELVARIDAYAARVQDDIGVPVTRSAAIGALLTTALDTMEGKAKRRPR